MARGQTFHSQLTQPETPSPTNKRGRSKERIDNRNEKLAHRYFYYAHIQKVKSWDTIVIQLSEELDLCVPTVTRLLTFDIADVVKDLFQQKPTTNELKKRFPYFTW